MATKRKSFLWSVSLTLTLVICITIVYIYISRTVENQKFSPRIVKQNSIHTEKLTDENCIPTCGTKECVMQAKSLLSHIDSSVDPCDNAHSFLCGGFVKKIASHETQRPGDPTIEKLWIEVKNILDNLQPEPGSPSAKMKIVYDSCMDYGSSELQEALPFQKFLENDLGIADWPYLDSNFKFADLGLSKLLGIAKSLEEFPVFVINTHYKANYTHSVYFHYEEMNKTVIKSEGAVHALKYFDLTQEDIESIVSDFEDVEKSIVELYASLEHTENCIENCTYVDCSNLNDEEWALLCETVETYHNEMTKFSGEERKDDFIIEVIHKQVILKNLLLLMDSLPDKTVANYFAIRFLWKFLEEINFYFRLTKLKYDDGRYTSNKVQPILWKHCIKWIRRNMKLSLTKEFFRHYLRPSITEQISDFFTTSISDLKRIIELQEWIPPERKSDILIDQVGTLKLNIMEIKNILENSAWLDSAEDYIKVFHPTRESFFDNVLQYKKINVDDVMRRASTYSPSTMSLKNTYFGSGGQLGAGVIHMNYGFFYPPYFTPYLRREINRISNALILGHEIGHVVYYTLAAPINDTGYIPEFQEVVKCIENQFSEFKFDILKKNLNGSRYNRENIADYVGSALIDKILDEYESAEQMQFMLPGLAYSTNQFLYMSAYQLLCSKDNLESEKRYQEYDHHAPYKFRIIGPSQNSRSYSRLFQCPDGSYMNPAKKCSLLS